MLYRFTAAALAALLFSPVIAAAYAPLASVAAAVGGAQ